MITIAVVCNVLVACGETSSSPPVTSSGIQGAINGGDSTPDQFARFQSRYARLSGSSHKAIPTSGSAQFQGYGQVIIRDTEHLTSHPILKGTGALKMMVNFDPSQSNKAAENRSITGSLTNITGYYGPNVTAQEVSKNRRSKINGSLEFTGGVIRKNNTSEHCISQVSTLYQGTLLAGNSSYNITGSTRHTENTKLIGTITNKDNIPSAIKGLQIMDNDGVATKTLTNGQSKTVTLTHGVSVEGYADRVSK